jgi:hypothetical protein
MRIFIVIVIVIIIVIVIVSHNGYVNKRIVSHRHSTGIAGYVL